MSADRLFRVRLKQPYASVCSPNHTSTTCTVAHDQCSDDDMTVVTPKNAAATVVHDDNDNNEIVDNKNMKSDDMAVPMPKNATTTVVHGQHDEIADDKDDSKNLKGDDIDAIVINDDDDDDDDDDTSNENAQAVEICTKSKQWLKLDLMF